MEVAYKYTILIIDPGILPDNELIKYLEASRITAVTANDTVSAFKCLQTFIPDIILLDINIDNGIELLNNISANRNLDKTSVILFVPQAGNEMEIPEASDYIAKPYNFNEVLARIKIQLSILGMKRINEELVERNRILQQITLTDELTGLYNRRYVSDKLNSEISHSARYNEPISFIMLDIDHFKKVNDTYGHITGDIVLKEVANQIRISIRESDIAIRYGGEEFLIVCTATNSAGAKILADRVHWNIKNNSLNYNEKKIRVTVSLGISSSRPEPHKDPQYIISNLIQSADIALYKAKSNGRNRIELFKSSEHLPLLNDELPQDNTFNYDKSGHDGLKQ